MAKIRVDIDPPIAVLTLDDPKRRNAFSLEMVTEIEAALENLEARPDIGALVVTGAPPAFCAGADLSHLEGAAREGLLRIYEGFLRIGRSPLPSIAAVNGAAVGAGMNLALVCDLRLAAQSAKFDCRFLELGLHPGGGHTWMLRRLVGPQTAAAMVLFSEILDGEEAVRCGLAWRLTADDALIEEAKKLALRTASAPAELRIKVRQTLRDVASIDEHRDAVMRELDPQVWSIEQPAFAERLAAMKRKISKR